MYKENRMILKIDGVTPEKEKEIAEYLDKDHSIGWDSFGCGRDLFLHELAEEKLKEKEESKGVPEGSIYSEDEIYMLGQTLIGDPRGEFTVMVDHDILNQMVDDFISEYCSGDINE